MWSRVVEVMLGCWLLMSPFLFHYAAGCVAVWANDLACGALLPLCTLLLTGFHYAYSSAVAPVGGWLIGFAYCTASTAFRPHRII